MAVDEQVNVQCWGQLLFVTIKVMCEQLHISQQFLHGNKKYRSILSHVPNNPMTLK